MNVSLRRAWARVVIGLKVAMQRLLLMTRLARFGTGAPAWWAKARRWP